MTRALSRLIAIIALLLLPRAAGAQSPQKLSWDNLATLVGRRISIPLYDGCAVSGKLMQVLPAALVLQVEKSSHPQSYPKGALQVPRATLFVLELHNAVKSYLGMGTAVDFVSAHTFRRAPDPRTTTIHIMQEPVSLSEGRT